MGFFGLSRVFFEKDYLVFFGFGDWLKLISDIKDLDFKFIENYNYKRNKN